VTVAELLPAAQRPLAGALLESLARKRLLRVREPGAYAFAHGLVRDAAYDSLPKRLRAELHAEIAERLEAGDDELVGHHLEQAYVYRRELGLLDESDTELAERGADRLAAAGRRAHAVGDTPAAVSLLTRAAGLCGRPAISAELGEALRDAGELALADATLVEAIEVGRALGDERAEAHASIVRWRMRLQGDRSGLSTNAAVLAEALLAQGRDEEALELTAQSERAAAAEDLVVQVQWRGPRAKALARRGELDAAELLAREAVSLAEQTDFLNLHANALLTLATVLHHGRRLEDAAAAAEAANALYERKGNLVGAEEAYSFVGRLETAALSKRR
jgi:predicted ATPase